MNKPLGSVLGGLPFIKGVTLVVRPRWLFRLWDKRLRAYFPSSFNRMVEDFSGLSDTTIRVMGFWVLAMGALVLWLARKPRA